jgi:predicted RNase H-like HicB family nuclease
MPLLDGAPCRHYLGLSYTPTGEDATHHEFTAVYERDGDWVIAFCPEVPGANGQGRSKAEARESLAAAIALVLEDRRDDGLRDVPGDAEKELISVDVRAA